MEVIMIYSDKMIVHKDMDNHWTRDSLLRKFLASHKETFNFSVKFEELTFDEFPDCIELTAFIDKEYRNKQGELYWCGDKYEHLRDLVADLSKQKNIFRIIVEYTEN
jgi:hypothetical protein